MTLDQLNKLSNDQATAEFHRCCGSKAWAAQMCARRPFAKVSELESAADEIWFKLSKQDHLEAFSHHPRIGGDLAKLREKFQSTKTWSSQEQAGVNSASEETLQALSQGNLDYEKKFGHVFLICATGKSADEMLAALKARIVNSAEQELKNAATEQSKIYKIRIAKLLESK